VREILQNLADVGGQAAASTCASTVSTQLTSNQTNTQIIPKSQLLTNTSGPGTPNYHQLAVDVLLLEADKAFKLKIPQYQYLSDHTNYTCFMQGHCNCNNDIITIYNDSFTAFMGGASGVSHDLTP
jgi:hypothetical protein